jgi:hypothetical protein
MALSTCLRTVSLVVACLAGVAGCSRQAPTEAWPPNTDPVVFADTFGDHVGFQAFMGSKLDAVSVDNAEKYQGTASLKVTVPAPGSTAGGYSGGAFVTSRARSLAGYNALSLYIKADRVASLDVVGLGNDNTGASRFEASRAAIPVGTEWTQVLVPIPLPARLEAEKGLFFFADSTRSTTGLTVWMDEIRFVYTTAIANPRPVLSSSSQATFAGSSLALANVTRTTFDIAGVSQVVAHMPEYFDYTSTDTAVATVSRGVIRVRARGNSTITAQLGGVTAAGSIAIAANEPPPTTAPMPALAAGSVISLFSSMYTNVPVDKWSADWDRADVADIAIGGHVAKVYTNLSYAGIEFTSHLIDATAMTHLHFDAWATSGTTLKVKLVDFGADGVYSGCANCGDDRESEVTLNATSTPALTPGTWADLDLPLSGFTQLTGRAHLAQIVLSGDTRTLFVDHLLLHR